MHDYEGLRHGRHQGRFDRAVSVLFNTVYDTKLTVGVFSDRI